MRGAGFLLTPQPCLGHQEPPAARRALGTLLPSHRDPRLAWKPNLSCSIPPPSHLDTSRALTKPPSPNLPPPNTSCSSSSGFWRPASFQREGRASPLSPTLAPLAGVAGEDGMEAQLWLLWLALELDRVGEAAREEGLDLRPRDRNGVIPCEAPSGRMNFSRSSRLVRPRAGRGERRGGLRFGGTRHPHRGSGGSRAGSSFLGHLPMPTSEGSPGSPALP